MRFIWPITMNSYKFVRTEVRWQFRSTDLSFGSHNIHAENTCQKLNSSNEQRWRKNSTSIYSFIFLRDEMKRQQFKCRWLWSVRNWRYNIISECVILITRGVWAILTRYSDFFCAITFFFMRICDQFMPTARTHWQRNDLHTNRDFANAIGHRSRCIRNEPILIKFPEFVLCARHFLTHLRHSSRNQCFNKCECACVCLWIQWLLIHLDFNAFLLRF